MLKASEIYKIISECTEETSKTSAKSVQEIFYYFSEIIKKQLLSEGEIKLPYLGKLKVKIGRERVFNDPKTNELKKLPPHPKLLFRPCKELKEEVNKISWEYEK